MMRLIFLFFALCGFADAPSLQGLVLLSHESELFSAHEIADLHGIFTEKIKPPRPRSELEALLSPFCRGFSINSETISAIKKAIHSHYALHKEPLALVSIPPQNISQGVLQIVVAPSKLGSVRVQGNSSSKQSERLLSFAPGEEIRSDNLQRNLHFFNRNPFRKTEVIFSPGSLPRTTDITLVMQEKRPFQIFAGTENTGVEPTQQGRIFSGIHFTALQRDLVGLLTYHASYDFYRFQSWSGQLTAFLPWKHILKLLGSYALIHPNTSDFEVKNRGMSDQISLRYTIPSPSHDFSLGFDFKQLNNILEYANFPFPYSEIKLVTVSQLAAGYAFSHETANGHLELQVDAFGSPGSLFPHQSNEDFSQMNRGAKNLYAYANALFKYERAFLLGTFALTSSAQVATGSLLPSEQVGIGGYGTVRGYEERSYNADQAILCSLEWSSPSWPLFFHRKKGTDQVHLLAFFDGACGMTYNENESEYLFGAGPGFRYVLPPFLSLRLDLGFRLRDLPLFTSHFYKWHFNLSASY